VIAEGLVESFEHPTVGRYRGVARPLKFSASPGPNPFAAPSLGQHTAEVLTRFGFSDVEVQELRRLNVLLK